MQESNTPIVLCENLVKIYKIADLEVVALQGLDLEIQSGEITALVGPSGAGKSTLLNVIGGLDTPSAGQVRVANADLLTMKDKNRAAYKRDTVGFVWQQPARNLLPYLSARENVEMPMLLNKVPSRQRRERALKLLDMVGLSDRAKFTPDRLSGGQQQRVALAVALANNPPLLLGDELTGQVDSQSASEVYSALRRINQHYGTTIIIVTHDPQVADLVDRVVAIRDGRTSTEIRRQRVGAQVVDEAEWVILDKAGRLQIPGPFVEKLGLKERVKVKLKEDHVSVWPETSTNQSEASNKLNQFTPPAALIIGDQPRTGAIIRVENLWREFRVGMNKVTAVQDISLAVPPGTVALFKGRSGSGKTTLLNLIAGLDQPTAGRVLFDGKDIGKLPERSMNKLRRSRVGFVYQTFGLLPFLSAGENVEIPLRMLRTPRKERRERVKMLLELVGLGSRINHRTYELSGGEQQRVAIARALVNRPALLLADEPTGQLDTTTGGTIIALLRMIAEQLGVTVMIASHDPNIAASADKIFELQDGRLIAEATPDQLQAVLPPQVSSALQRCAQLIKANKLSEAQSILSDMLRKDNTIEKAWFMLSFTLPEQNKKIYALQQTLQLNPHNTKAQQRLERLQNNTKIPFIKL